MAVGPAYLDVSAPLETRVESLLEALTSDEKLNLCAGQGAWGTKPVPRLGLRSFRMTDGPRGIGFHSSGKRCTAFPSGISHAASWGRIAVTPVRIRPCQGDPVRGGADGSRPGDQYHPHTNEWQDLRVSQ